MSSPAQPLNPAIEIPRARQFEASTRHLSRAAQRSLYLAVLVVADVALLAAAFGLAYWLRFYSGLPIFVGDGDPQPAFYAWLAAVLVPLWLALFWVYRLYEWDTLLGGTREYELVFHASVTGAVIIALVQFVFENMIIARGWVGLAWGLAFGLVALGRFGLRRIAYAARKRGYLLAPAIIVGASDEARLLGEQLVSWPTSGLAVLGYLDDEHPAGTRLTQHLNVLGGLEQLDEYVQRYGIEEVILATSGLTRATILSVFRKYGNSPDVHLRLSSGLFDIMTTGLMVKELASVPLIGVNRVRLSRTDEVLKAILDYAITLAGLAVLAPVFLVIGILVKLDSPGPVFYRRRVVGLHGKQFDALKFRTMRIDGDEILKAHPALMDHLATTHKIKGDPRITRIGQLLRKYSLDELPQLINVLRREMSLVGPRMISPPELKHYGQWAMNLLTVRPGLTGLWQVSGRSDVSYEERVRLDMFYIRNYNIWMDIHLIARTVPVVLSGRGAY